MSEHLDGSDGHTCGSCYWYVPNRMQLGTGSCRWGPPGVITAPIRTAAGSGVNVTGMYPPMAAKDIGCSQHSARKGWTPDQVADFTAPYGGETGPRLAATDEETK